jgi:hypothetical protein
MLFIFSTPELIRNLWQLKTAIFLHWCLIHAVPLQENLCFDEHTCIFEHHSKIKTFLNPRMTYFVLKICLVYLFKDALYKLNFLLHKDGLLYRSTPPSQIIEKAERTTSTLVDQCFKRRQGTFPKRLSAVE